jgi:outer membrane protein assembly factor BamA
LRVRWAPRGLGSDIPFIKVQAHHSQYVTLTDWLAGLYAVRIGWARTVNSDEVVPLRERFFLGGRSTVRGFPENELGPLGAPIFDQFGNKVFPGGNPLGGDLAINLNAELRVPLLFGVSGVVFSDSGAVYLLDRSTPPEDFRFTMGPGLLYMTPVGPIALHYGFKLDRRTGESAGEVHFSIGAVF